MELAVSAHRDGVDQPMEGDVMQVAATPPARNGNPGIVPPHLLAPAPSLTVTPPAAESTAGEGRSPEYAYARSTQRLGLRRPMPGESEAAKAAIRETADFFRSLGVTERDGNQPGLKLGFMTAANAAYSFEKDAILVGRHTGGSFADSKDVLAHEYSHRVIDKMVGLSPAGESGVMHESLADTFASAMDNDWTIGEDITPGGLRDMLHPERHGDPGHVSQYRRTGNHSRDVHSNNGIPNKAAALIGEQLGRRTMAQIYVDAMRKMEPRTGIIDAAKATLLAAGERYGEGSEQVEAVANAWEAVGVLGLVLDR